LACHTVISTTCLQSDLNGGDVTKQAARKVQVKQSAAQAAVMAEDDG
jgi:hypothetical protein